MSITDEQIAAIARKHYANLSQSDTMDLFQALRERDAQLKIVTNERDIAVRLAGQLGPELHAKIEQCEAWGALENAIYEFTKRADRAYPLKPALPAVEHEGKGEASWYEGRVDSDVVAAIVKLKKESGNG